MSIQEAEAMTAIDARVTVLELTVAAMVAQLPEGAREEVVGMLAFVADASGDAQRLADPSSVDQLDQLQHWAGKMLDRAMSSRKASRPASLTAEQAAASRHPVYSSPSYPSS